MSHDSVYLLLGGGAGTMVLGHPVSREGQPCPVPSFEIRRVPLKGSWPCSNKGQGGREGAAGHRGSCLPECSS